jgi:hypothetical protein
VGPVTWAGRDNASPARRSRRSDVTTPASIALHVSRPSAHVDIVVQRDGWADVAVRRPGADAVVRATAQLESVAAFGALVDRAVELITWSGVPKDDGPGARSAERPERAGQWVAGYDGQGWPKPS